MADRPAIEFASLSADLQIAFYFRLGAVRQTYLFDALSKTVADIRLPDLDAQLLQYAPGAALTKLAESSLRGELVFATPLILAANPFLLGYYRLLYGLSQKEFFSKGPFGWFKKMEDRGELPDSLAKHLPALCHSLGRTAAALVAGLDALSRETVHELQLLTLGPQLRGSENTRIGEKAVVVVRKSIAAIAGNHIVAETPKSLSLENAAGRTINIQFGSDPDVLISERLFHTSRLIVSIEVKGGGDASNIHNRLGEAEKSHLKAKKLGCNELWTVTKVPVEQEVARRNSPTTTRFFHLDAIGNARTKAGREFREAIISQLGLRS